VLSLLLEYQPDGAFLDFRGIPFRCAHDSILSKFGVSENPGAVQFAELTQTLKQRRSRKCPCRVLDQSDA
jgi:hypothetical protein